MATQIYQATKQIAKHSETEIRVVNYVGGTDKQRQIEKLKVAQPHIVIGTPGRIYDLVKSGDLAIHKAHTFVVDEADMTMDMGFLDTVDKIAASLPKEVQILVFSATIPQKLQPFLKKYLTNPVMEQIKTSTVIADTIDNWLVSTKGRNKNEQILEMLKGMQPYLAMIFVNTKERADDLHSYLVSNGLKVAKIHGGIPPRERKRIMNQVKKLDFEYIVATDLAARGIDIEGVSHVINDAILKTCPSLFTVWGVQDVMVCQEQPLPFINQVTTQIFVSLKRWGLPLTLKSIRTASFKIPMTVTVVPTVKKPIKT